ncbi:MAG TPA: hypothetical protein VGM44_04205 [Polyangiaceae bacterium]|jgi:hypothetical protein
MIKSVGTRSFVFILASLPLAGCYAQAGMAPAQPVGVAAEPAPVAAQPVEAEPEYYYGGPHFYPAALGGEWCPIGEPHVHDFPPDHPEWYAYDSGYYYYSGRPGEAYVVGQVPRGARVHAVREGEAHGWRRLPPAAPHAPYVAGGRYPTREEHPAPAHPVAMHGAQNTQLTGARTPDNHEPPATHETRSGGEVRHETKNTASQSLPDEHGSPTGAAAAGSRPGTEPRQPREGEAKGRAPEPAAAQHPAAASVHPPTASKPTAGKSGKGSEKKKENK